MRRLPRYAWWARRGLFVALLAGAAAIAFDVDYYLVLGDDTGSLDDVAAAESRMLAAGWVELATLLVAGVPFILWFRRAHRVAKEDGGYAMRYGSGWTIGGWFVPIVNLILPKKIANDLWKAGDAWDRDVRPRGISPLLHWWWAAWVLWYVVSAVAERIYSGADTLSGFRSGVVAFILSDAVWIVAAALAWLVVRSVTQRLESLPVAAPTAAPQDS